MTAPELKPCPFCGGEADASDGIVYCSLCSCRLPQGFGYEGEGNGFATDYEAIAAWNRRADLAAVPAQVRVKPLVWDEPRDANNWVNIARSVFGDYYISIDGGRCSAWLEAHVEPYENKIGDDVGSVIEAMILAERDYEAKTRALIIEPQPDPRDEVIARLVEAVEAIADYGTILTSSKAHDELRAALAAAKAVQHG